ncbi:hypothetical protein GE061_000070 [Apolygus lucorum]|uniref:HTH psq-type domain-containing protein n=1 Tax=Apolygus lucorum TaxID=248454 RepID=A0A6A4KIT6_APOLU|nr:hypothetical protein GE061_000070 [Apolygus lucorum]
MVARRKKLRFRKSGDKLKKLQYSEETMLAAIEDLRAGLPVATAAKKHIVPRATLRDKVNGRTPVGRRMGPHSILSETEEKVLVKWIKLMSEKGFPSTPAMLLASAACYADDG